MSGSDVKFRVFNPDHFGATPGSSDMLLAVLATPFHPIMSHETDEPVHETSAVYLITELAKHLLLLGHEAASRYGEKLLAMEVTITSDPLTVIEIGYTETPTRLVPQLPPPPRHRPATTPTTPDPTPNPPRPPPHHTPIPPLTCHYDAPP